MAETLSCCAQRTLETRSPCFRFSAQVHGHYMVYKGISKASRTPLPVSQFLRQWNWTHLACALQGEGQGWTESLPQGARGPDMSTRERIVIIELNWIISEIPEYTPRALANRAPKAVGPSWDQGGGWSFAPLTCPKFGPWRSGFELPPWP